MTYYRELAASLKMIDGRPTLMVEGKPVVPLIYALSDIPASYTWTEQAQRNIRHFATVGINLVQVHVFFRDCWLKEAPYFDAEPMRKVISEALKANPDAGIIIRLHLSPPAWWLTENPEECCGYYGIQARDQGNVERLIAGDLEDYLRVSLSSEKWLKEAGERLALMCREFSHTQEGARVVGIQPAGGVYAEWHQWAFELYNPDYGPCMVKRFRRFLRENYQTEAALQTAWNDPSATFDTAEIPSPEARMASRNGVFRDPKLDRAVMDSLKCLQLAPVEAILHFCAIVKENWPRPVLCGAFYGYYFQVGNNGYDQIGGHLEIKPLLESPVIDYLSSPFIYVGGNRPAGGPGVSRNLVESIRLHGKLFLCEMDQCPIGTEFVLGGLPERRQESISILRRNVMRYLLQGCGCWYFDHRVWSDTFIGDIWHKNGWWDNSELLAEIRCEREVYERYFQRPYQPQADVVLIYDTESAYLRNITLCDADSDVAFVTAAAKSGAMVDCIYMHDMHLVDWSRCKAAVFVRTPRITPEQFRFIRKHIIGAGCTPVWIHAPGFSDGEAISDSFVSKTTGFKLTPTTDTSLIRFHGCGLPDTDYLANRRLRPVYAVTDPAAESAGFFIGTNAVSAARKRDTDGNSEWFFAAAPSRPDILREVFRSAGAHIYNENCEPVVAGSGLVMLHTKDGGERKLLLRNGKQAVADLPPFTTWLVDAETGETVLP